MTTQISADNIQPSTLESIGGGPKISNVQVTNSSYVVLDDTAVALTGGYIKITGSGFASGCTVIINGTAATSVSFVSSSVLNVQVGPQSAGTYIIYVTNTDGSTAIRVNGITYSGTPTWVTSSTLPSAGVDGQISIQLSATGDTPMTYALQAGSSLPTGLTLTSGGLLSGIITGITVETVYNFTIEAIDPQSQESPRAFSITITIGDSYWTSVTTLLSASSPSVMPFNDDASTNNFPMTIVGDTRPFNFNPYTPGYYSNYFDGSTGKLTLPSSASMSLTGEFTIECWVNWGGTTTNYQNFIGSNNTFTSNASFFRVWGSTFATLGSKVGIGNPTHDGISSVYSTTSLLPNVWYHVAATRDSSNIIRVFVNGVLERTGSTDTSTYDFGQGGTCIGDSPWDGAQGWYQGYISNLRVIKGTCLYTASFTPSTSPLTAVTNTSLLTCQSNRFIDNSTNSFVITVTGTVTIKSLNPYTPNTSYSTYGSTYFDGNIDYLSTPTGPAAFDFSSTKTMTLEFWAYTTSWGGTYSCFFDIQEGSPFRFMYLSGTLYWQTNAGNTTALTGSITLATNTWYHYAFVRNNDTLYIFVNGAQVATGSYTAAWGTTATGFVRIGTNRGDTWFFNGYMTDFRLVKGTALYTSAFTPPAAPLTAISGTSLLTCQTDQPVANNTFLDSSTLDSAITKGGNVTQGTFSPYGENYSVFFDGTGDFLSLPCGDYINYGTGDFTVEFWINTKGSGGLFAPPSTITTTAWDFSISGGNFLWRNRLTATTVWSYSAAAATDGLWHHVAVARQSSSSRLFIDGSLVATNTDNNNWNGNESGKTFTIGQSGLGDFTGYLSNVRFVKGIALYTGTFTPSTTPLQPVNSYTNFLVCQSRNFVDNSASNRALTANGNVSVQKLGPFKSPTLPTPYYSNYFDGTGDYLTIAGNNAFNLYTGDWTIEYWFYHTGDKLATHISQGEYNWRIAQDGSSITVTTQITTRITATAIALYMWHHLALVSYNGTITLYIDGVSKGTTTAYPGNDSGSTIYIGRNPATTAWDINGYLSNIRIVKGTAVYTSAFTPPTSPLTAIANTSLLTCQSSTFIDNSTNNFTITVNGNSQPTKFNPFTLNYSIRQSYTPSVYGGSMYFDGSLDSLALTTTTPLTISTSPFTMEAWIYPTSFAHAFYILVNRVNNSTGVGTYYFAVETTGTLNFNQLQGPAVIITTAAGVIPLNAWTHVAVVRNSSNVWYLYVNGVSSGTTAPTNAYDFSSTNTTYIGYNPDANVWSSFGYLSDVRIIKGEAIYTSNFVPSSAPMSAIKNTVLLANGTGAGIYDSSENTEFETIGDAKLSTTTVKFSGTTSIYFDGTGDYLSTSTNLVNFAFGTGDFTVEMWVYQTSLAAAMLVDFRGATNNVAPTIELTAAGKVLVYKEGTGTLITSTNSITAATWTNVAVTRSGTSLKVFINGVQDPTTATDSTNWSAPSGKLTIGANKDAGSLLNGYLSDFRITKGAARYTATFTPSTAPFPTK